MRLEYQQNLRLEQRLVQSPQMIQAMQILQLTTPELLERIEAELEDNPFLERSADGAEATAAAGDGAATETAATEPPAGTDEGAAEGDEADLPGIGDLDQVFEPGRGPSSSRATEAARDFDPVQQLAAPDPHSIDSILGELRVGAALPGQLDLAELILVSLDPRGFLPEGTTTLAAEAGVDHAELLAVIEQLRQVAHPALAAQDLRECFLLQLRALPERRPLPEAIVESHFADLLANRLPQIAKALEVPLGEIRVALEVLSTLDYRPLAELEPDDSMRILPDVLLETNEDGGYDVNLARDGLPELSLTRGAREALEKAKGNKRLYEHLVKKIERARWFLDAVNQRRVTLSRITQALVGRQREFLDYGPERLRPLKMQEIADEVGVHISTVSRAIRGKYAQTPQGILPLKGFFSGGQRTASGGERSRVSIQQRIREIVDAEDKGAPLSDEEVVRILRDRDGVKVARRTVTKYRLAMNIPSSNLRRSH